MARKYNGISHPSIGVVCCRYCGSSAGIPCKKLKLLPRIGITIWMYTETHSIRIKDYENGKKEISKVENKSPKIKNQISDKA